jgi:hypothetical protein
MATPAAEPFLHTDIQIDSYAIKRVYVRSNLSSASISILRLLSNTELAAGVAIEVW